MIPALSLANEAMVLMTIFSYTEEYLKNYETTYEVSFGFFLL